MISIAYNIDSMEYMRTLPDKHFDLVIADPPYGDGVSQTINVEEAVIKRPLRWRKEGWSAQYGEKITAWDVAPRKEVFDEIFRISRNQIIWGGNYFNLPPTRCFLVWRKLSISESFTMAMAEYAWTSFDANAKVFEAAPQGKNGDKRIHPTQKPIELYRWIYNLYAEKGQKVFDPFLGSGSSRIAAYDAGLDFVGCEIDSVYYAKQEERFANYTAQTTLFD